MDAYTDPSRDPSDGDPLEDSNFASSAHTGASPAGEDFLGLGQDLDAHMSADDSDEEDYEYSDEEQAASWLFTLDDDSEGASETPIADFAAAAPADFAAAAPADYGQGSFSMEDDGSEGMPAGSPFGPDAYDPGELQGALAPDYEGDPAGYDEDVDGPSALDASWTEPESSTGLLRRHGVRLAAAVVLLGVGFAGWQLYGVSGDLVTSPETKVLAPEQNKTPKYAPQLQSPDGQRAAPSNRRTVKGQSTQAPGDLAAANSEPMVVPEELLARAKPRSAARGRWRTLLGVGNPAGGRLLDALPNFQSGPMGPRLTRGGDRAGGPALLRRSGRLQSDFVDVPSFPNLRLATAKDLENVWPGFEIPVDEYGRSERLLTPYVGDVRAILDSGDIFEGRLYAVGEHRIWVETGWGVMALETQRLEAIVHVGPAQGDLASNDGPITRMPSIRVEAKGGGFPARLLYQDDRGATVVTEGGTRITVDPSDVAIVGLTPSVVLAEDPLR